MDYTAKDPDKGFTVLELHEVLLDLIVKGYHDTYVYERRFDEHMRYLKIYGGPEEETKRVAIAEAY